MKTKNALNEVKKMSRLAWAASSLPIGANFAALPSIVKFLRLMENDSYVFADMCLELDGCSVRNSADQVFQFCCSIEQNEADTQQGI
jgi:hypothetical protein